MKIKTTNKTVMIGKMESSRDVMRKHVHTNLTINKIVKMMNKVKNIKKINI